MALQILNRLGPLYNGYSGIYPDLNGECEAIYDLDSEELIKDAFDNNHKVVREDDDTPLNNFQEYLDDEECEYAKILYDYKKLKKDLEENVNQKKVIVKFTDGNWYDYPEKWYNLINPKTRNRTDRKYRLPRLWTRKYITVDNPFWEIRIDANIKGSPITIDDVLFATRALMADHTRTINGGYKVVQETNDILILEPDIDNFSS
ncbi:hypothetical protein Klosneuvirus_3_293 [Klosneuvirus KNV1]|uniref:Uncharacterized protein n=1 Tax=Klosneuvirus KNV1 TaxID=1977640 RepID=A0A1V0SKL2_9VIRU|nr:hypothetical protein Klosneuvirus_3_293 [Klosneuvirus KNV1]